MIAFIVAAVLVEVITVLWARKLSSTRSMARMVNEKEKSVPELEKRQYPR